MHLRSCSPPPVTSVTHWLLPSDLPSFPPTHQVLSHLGYLTHAVPSTWRHLPSALCIMGFFSCLGPELKCHLLRGGLPDPDHCSPQVLPLVLFPLHPPFLFLTLSTICTFFFLYPSFMCAPSARIQTLLKESIVSVFSTPMFVMFVPHCLAHRRCLIIEIEWSLA